MPTRLLLQSPVWFCVLIASYGVVMNSGQPATGEKVTSTATRDILLAFEDHYQYWWHPYRTCYPMATWSGAPDPMAEVKKLVDSYDVGTGPRQTRFAVNQCVPDKSSPYLIVNPPPNVTQRLRLDQSLSSDIVKNVIYSDPNTYKDCSSPPQPKDFKCVTDSKSFFDRRKGDRQCAANILLVLFGWNPQWLRYTNYDAKTFRAASKVSHVIFAVHQRFLTGYHNDLSGDVMKLMPKHFIGVSDPFFVFNTSQQLRERLDEVVGQHEPCFGVGAKSSGRPLYKVCFVLDAVLIVYFILYEIFTCSICTV